MAPGFLEKMPASEGRALALAEAPEIPYVDWKKSPNMRKLYFYAVILCVASATTGYDGSMFNSMQILPAWVEHFDAPRKDVLGRLSAMYAIGSIASLPVAPIISDRFGRKVSISCGCVIMVIAASLQTAAPSQPQFEGGRFFMGFGNSLAQLSSPLLLTEICHPQHRARVTTVYNCLWNLGALICAWISFGTSFTGGNWSWRIPTLIQVVPSVIQLSFIWWIPESPRWLISKDRSDEALNILGYYHADGDNNAPLVQFEYAEIKETIRLEFLYRKTSRYTDFFKTKGNRYRLAIIVSLGLISQLSGNSLLSYYSNIIYDSVGVTATTTKLGLDAGNKVLSLIVSITCAVMVDKFGRRPLFLIATALMFLFFLAMTITGARYTANPTKGVGYLFIVFVWLHGVAYALAWSGLLIAYTVEVLPFKLRAKGLTVMNVCVQVALVIGQYVNPLAIDKGAPWENSGWKLYCIYTVWIFLELVWIYFAYPETKYVMPRTFPLPSQYANKYSTGARLWRRSPVSSMVMRPRSVPLTSRATKVSPMFAPAPSARLPLVVTRRRPPTLPSKSALTKRASIFSDKGALAPCVADEAIIGLPCCSSLAGNSDLLRGLFHKWR
jgi:sugar porter (SP) family MFS transporter